MSQTSNVLLVSGAAQMAFESLKKNASHKDLHDLGNGSVELLREVLTQVVIGEKYPELKQTAEALGLLLLLLRGLLLEWDCEDFPEAIFELPLQRLPKSYPNKAWKLAHPCPRVLAEETKASLRFLESHAAFEGEPWKWLADTFRTVEMAFE
jgi:hypothetical protein